MKQEASYTCRYHEVSFVVPCISFMNKIELHFFGSLAIKLYLRVKITTDATDKIH
jgi:hypothetical protein